MGASRAVLKLEDSRILRGIKAHANREANAETSNLRRVVASGLRQAEVVRRLTQSGLLEQLPPGLREIAQARAATPSASLQQLADQLGVSKSAVAGRLRRLLRTEDAGQA
jgi:DNA-binding protein WhiA